MPLISEMEWIPANDHLSSKRVEWWDEKGRRDSLQRPLVLRHVGERSFRSNNVFLHGGFLHPHQPVGILLFLLGLLATRVARLFTVLLCLFLFGFLWPEAAFFEQFVHIFMQMGDHSYLHVLTYFLLFFLFFFFFISSSSVDENIVKRFMKDRKGTWLCSKDVFSETSYHLTLIPVHCHLNVSCSSFSWTSFSFSSSSSSPLLDARRHLVKSSEHKQRFSSCKLYIPSELDSELLFFSSSTGVNSSELVEANHTIRGFQTNSWIMMVKVPLRSSAFRLQKRFELKTSVCSDVCARRCWTGNQVKYFSVKMMIGWQIF